MNTRGQPTYQIRFRSRRVLRELDSLSQVDYRRINAAIEALATEPRPVGAAQLDDGIFRIRVGRYRVIYRVNDQDRRIDIGGVRRRTERTYRGVRDLFSQ